MKKRWDMPVRGMSQRFFLKALAGEKPRLPSRQAGHQLVKKVQRDFFDKLEAASACSGSRFGSLVAEFVFGSVRFDDIGAVKL